MLLAKRLGVSYQNVYKWIEAGRVPPKRVKQIVELANGNILQSELLKFVI
jgi:DNA-binding transcriptional regulator YdaS (Cro superfamily)